MIIMAIIIGFTMFRANRIKKHPEKSVTFENDRIRRAEMNANISVDNEVFTGKQKGVLLVFIAGLALVIFGLINFGWYMNELSMVFLGMGIAMGIIGGLNERQIAEEFIEGVKGISFAAIVIGFCNGIMIIAQDGMIIDTILNAMANILEGATNFVFVGCMYVVQSLLALLVPS